MPWGIPFLNDIQPLAPRIYEGGARRAGGVRPQYEFAGVR